VSAGQPSSIIGHTLVNPAAQLITALLVIGQLQSHSHCSLPSGQSHLQEHGIPSPIGGSGPDPEPVIGTGVSPDPEPVIGTGVSPDPDPVIGTGVSPDPGPVVGSVGSTGPTVGFAATLHFVILPFPFLTARVNE